MFLSLSAHWLFIRSASFAVWRRVVSTFGSRQGVETRNLHEITRKFNGFRAMLFFRDFSCGFRVPSTCRDPQGEMMCASTSFQSRKRLGKSMGFRVPARSASSDAAASGNMMALLERVRGGVSLIQIRGNRLGAVGKNIFV